MLVSTLLVEDEEAFGSGQGWLSLLSLLSSRVRTVQMLVLLLARLRDGGIELRCLVSLWLTPEAAVEVDCSLMTTCEEFSAADLILLDRRGVAHERG